jgi:hypothetical protein
MRKLAIIGATIGLLAAATSAVSIASASTAPHRAAPHGAAASSVKVLHLISRQTSLKVIDLGKKGPSAGDQIMESTADFQHHPTPSRPPTPSRRPRNSSRQPPAVLTMPPS